MKKMFLTAAVIVSAVFAQAGTVTWGSTVIYNADGQKAKATATMYIYMCDAVTYDSFTDAWAQFGDDIKAGGANASNPNGRKSSSVNSKATVLLPDGTATPDTTYYAAVIMTIGTGDDMVYYAEKASFTTGNDGNYTYAFGGGAIDSATTAASAWKSVTTPITPPGPGGEGGVPEPTSGLLLLVGGALLALRRKQK